MSAPFNVAVTGLGLMTGLGNDLETSWRGILAGESRIAPFSLFDPGDLAAGFGSQLPDGVDELFKKGIRKRRRDQMTRGTMLAITAGTMALEQAGLAGKGAVAAAGLDPYRVGVVVGTTGTGYAPAADQGPDQHRILRNMSNSPACWLSLTHKLGGPSFTVSTACSSGVYALAAAASLIQTGQCDVVLAGASDSSLNLPDVRGFASLMALSEELERAAVASRPFDLERSGFVMGEGGGYLVLERPETARARGVRALAHMPPPALTSETYNIISPEPGGRGMERTMRLALDLAGLQPDAVGYLNAHGTSTQLNDMYEASAVRSVFGEHASRLPVSSTKGATGHCLAGAAGVESVVSVLALRDGAIPPTANLEQPDPELGALDLVAGAPRRAALDHVMCNSFAFGGHNGVVIFSRPRQ